MFLIKRKQSLRRDVLPYLVRSKLISELLSNGVQLDEKGSREDTMRNNEILPSRLLANASTQSFHELYALGPDGSASVTRKIHMSFLTGINCTLAGWNVFHFLLSLLLEMILLISSGSLYKVH